MPVALVRLVAVLAVALVVPVPAIAGPIGDSADRLAAHLALSQSPAQGMSNEQVEWTLEVERQERRRRTGRNLLLWGSVGAGVGLLMMSTGTDSKAFALNVMTIGGIVALFGYIKHSGASDDLRDLQREGILRGYSK